ncbi:MAG: hypothetical protein CME65_03500 [Halobacteriovoraceae bacterium]|nr:hypothetical protein [Halobacteriovoraceae bacterium]|tara:strand:- start:1107 stop:2210 length:1104 start_codon:yes stop_codon:yes gene_type:complete
MKNLLVLFTLVFSVECFASTVARVLEIDGKAFSFMNGKNPSTLKYGDQIEDLSDIMVEDSSHLSLVNTEGDVLHITGGTLLKVYKKNIELKNGQVWTVARGRGSVTTTNAVAEYIDGQFVTSFDNISGKTQVMVITGDIKLANSLEPRLMTTVSAGQFSIVDPEYEKNLPRTPTQVGKQSFQSLRAKFANFETLDNPDLNKVVPGAEPTQATAGRSLASVVEGFTKTPTQTIEKRGKIIRIYTTTDRKPASAHKYYMGLQKKKTVRGFQSGESASIRYFGKKHQPKLSIKTNTVPKVEQAPVRTEKNTQRLPASVPSGADQLVRELKKSSFEKSLEQKTPEIKRHSNEVNQLIDSLKTYKKDYQKNY